MDSPSSLWTEILMIILLTGVNAIFAAAELAFVSVNQTKIQQLADEGDKKAERVLQLLADSDDFLATIQVVITFAGFLSSGAAATTFVSYIVDWLPHFPGAQTAALIIVTAILAYMTLVLGELFPKQIALQMPEKIAMATSGLITVMQKIFKPFIVLLSASTDLLQKITPIEFTKETEKFTREEMNAIIRESRNEGSIDIEEYTMLQGVLSLDDIMVREVMVPRTDTIMIDIEDDYNEIMDLLLNTPYSRIPIYEGDKDNVIGVIHIKKILNEARDKGFDHIDIRALMSSPLFVPSTIYIDDLLVEFRREQQHIAILKDEYGGVEGIATLEDIIEEIVGEIEDESDLSSNDEVQEIDPDNYTVNGMLTLDKFNDFFNTKIESTEVDTIAGLMIYHIGFVPEDDDLIQIRLDDYVLSSAFIENGRIRSIHVTRDPDHNIQAEYDFAEEETNIRHAIEDVADNDATDK